MIIVLSINSPAKIKKVKHSELDNRILIRYLTDDCTEKEIDRVQRWMQQSAANKRKFKEFKYIWESAEKTNGFLKTFDPEPNWTLLKKQIDQQQKVHSTGSSRGSRHTYLFMRIAAIFLITAFIGFFAYQHWSSADEIQKQMVLQEITTDLGQRVDLTLADGTRVLLNAGSRLKIPEVFQSDEREVYLQGQAYFNVAPNSDKPFIVHLNETEIRVLGTSFSVSAYPEEQQIQIIVKEGRVSFVATQSPTPAATILTAGEMGQYNLKSQEIEFRKVADLTNYLSWIDGYLKYEETPMREVAADLERRYNVEVIFEDAQIENMVLTANLKSRSIRNVLDVIAVSLKIDYQLDNNRVKFFNP